MNTFSIPAAIVLFLAALARGVESAPPQRATWPATPGRAERGLRAKLAAWMKQTGDTFRKREP